MIQIHMMMWLNNQVKSSPLQPPYVAHVVLIEEQGVLQAKSIHLCLKITTNPVDDDDSNEATGLALKKILHSSQLSLKDMMICLVLARSIHPITKNLPAGMKSQHLSTT
ncbi:hypothetical protein XELAEV_18013208mg [Xenopus laevis]|uniref:Uncharacterized protein n=1 Tax=Xenopus laevis TaxID=8355 RepID=A0A974HYV0_XENLA|nr:hypothetical protein XELAEV_18013208mg [Xenopus laevis]